MLNYQELHFAAELPYPQTDITEKNTKYGRWILDNVGGIHSEMSAISLYLYQNFIIEKAYEDIIYVFHKISVVEMHHLSLFARLACALGEDPRLWTQNRNRKVYWSPGYNHYTADLKGLMHQSLEGELTTIEKYRQQAESIDDKQICALLERIILDEELHADIFRQIIRIYQL